MWPPSASFVIPVINRAWGERVNPWRRAHAAPARR